MDSSRESILAAGELMPIILERLVAGQKVCNMRFRGSSMMPMLRQGKDSVELASPPCRLKKYDLPMYRIHTGEYVIHRVVAVEDDHYVCLGDNTYAYERVAPEQVVALVCAFKRGERRIPVEAWLYKVYCRCWCMVIPVRRFVRWLWFTLMNLRCR